MTFIQKWGNSMRKKTTNQLIIIYVVI